MTLAEACEPLFQYVCRLNRSARKGAAMDMAPVRAEIKAALADCKSRAAAVLKGTPGEWEKAEVVLLYFIDFMVKASRLPWARDWKELAHERGLLAGDEDFFDELDKTLQDPSDAATERLGVFYTCTGLGFTGWFAGDPAKLRQYMAQMASRLRGTMDADRAAKICPEAYENINTADLVEPPSRKIVAVVIVLIGLGVTVAATNIVLLQAKKRQMRQALDTIVLKGEEAARAGKAGVAGSGGSGGSGGGAK